MSKIKRKRVPAKRPTIGLAVDAMFNFGRQILRGATQYANLKRKWRLVEDFQIFSTDINVWPQCDGMIVAASTPEILADFRRRSRYLISCSGGADPATTCIVSMDDARIGEMAAAHLMACRCPNFAFYGDPDFRVSRTRLEAFRTTLARDNFTCMESPIAYHWEPHPYGAIRPQWSSIAKWMHSLPKPVGIMAMDDMAARDLAGACLHGGLAVPDQIAIIGVNNDELLCESCWPHLSSINVGAERIGFAAARMMDRLLSGEHLKPTERVLRLPPLGVVRRMSTDILAIEDHNVATAVRFIHEHACDPCSVADVLRHVPVNRRWLERQFMDQLNRTVHDEIVHIRMDMACRMLLRRDFTLDEVAESCGFTTRSSFSRTFIQRTGESPAGYRRKRLAGRLPAAGETSP